MPSSTVADLTWAGYADGTPASSLPNLSVVISPSNNGGVAGIATIVGGQLKLTSSQTGISCGVAVLSTLSTGRDQTVSTYLDYQTSGIDPTYPKSCIHRHNGQPGSSETCYVVSHNPGAGRIDIDSVVNGSASLILYHGTAGTPPASTQLLLTTSCVGVNPTTFQVSLVDPAAGVNYLTSTVDGQLVNYITLSETTTTISSTTGLAGVGIDTYSFSNVGYFGETTIGVGGFSATAFNVDPQNQPTITSTTLLYAIVGGTGTLTITVRVSRDGGVTFSTLTTLTAGSGSIVDTGVTPGQTAIYQMTFSDSASNTGTAACAAVSPHAPTGVACIGDSNYAGNAGDFASNGNAAGAVSGGLLPYLVSGVPMVAPGHSVAPVNCGWSGTTSNDWTPTSTNIVADGRNCYTQARANWQAAGVTTAIINLGTNDSKYSSTTPATTPATYKANLASLIAQMKLDGMTAIGLEMPISPVQDLAANGAGTEVSLIPQYRAAQIQLCDNTTVYALDGLSWGYYANVAGIAADFNGLHPPGPSGQAIGLMRAAAFARWMGWIGGGVLGMSSGSGSTSTDPGISHVQAGITYEINGTNLTGTYDPVTGNFTDPGIAHVEAGTTYKFAGTTETGNYAGSGSGSYPSAQQIASAVVTAMATAPVGSVAATVSLNLSQPVPNTNTAGTVGDSLCAARAEGFGKVVYDPVAKSFAVYGHDDTSILKVFTVTTDGTGNVLGRA